MFVVAAFDATNPVADLRSFDEDLVLADMEIVTNRLQKVEDSLKKPLPRLEHQQFEHEHTTLKIVLAAMESGQPLRESHMTDEQQKVTRAFRLLSEKPRLVIVNTADDESQPERFYGTLDGRNARDGRARRAGTGTLEDEPRRSCGVRAGNEPGGHRLRLPDPHPSEDAPGKPLSSRPASPKRSERALLQEGGTAVEAAGAIHTDLARGFMRREVMTRHRPGPPGSDGEIKAHTFLRQEPKDYVVKDDDILRHPLYPCNARPYFWFPRSAWERPPHDSLCVARFGEGACRKSVGGRP